MTGTGRIVQALQATSPAFWTRSVSTAGEVLGLSATMQRTFPSRSEASRLSVEGGVLGLWSTLRRTSTSSNTGELG